MEIILKIGICIFRGLYALMKCLPTKKKAVFISRQSNDPSVDFNMIEEEIHRQHSDYKTVVLCKKIEGNIFNKIGYGFHMLRQMYHLATSQIVILDSYAILVSVLNHKKNLLVIQIWHSVGTMKKFGYSILDKSEGSSSKIAKLFRMHANYDYILASSEAYKAHLGEGMNYPVSKIKTFPLPRTQLLHEKKYADETRKKIFSEYPKLKGKENILYIPTFRKGKDDEAAFSEAAKKLCEAVDYSRYNLIVKAHPLAEFEMAHSQALIDKKFTSFEMLFVCDCIISDYSCIIYEAAALHKPMYMYTYDYDNYMSTRDIYMDYKKEMPGPILKSAEEVVSAIENNECDVASVDKFFAKYVTPNSENETGDIVEFIFSNLK